ncbi:MAG: putative DNA modification/repair radical SAM protein [Paludibacteraceae bacterium]
MNESTLEKLKILADAAKYDVSCASSGVSCSNSMKTLGTASGWGICHSFTADGRCISLFKILMTNHCIYDCAYCSNRRSNEVKRVAFTPKELADLTIEFYRRNYIEGLFLSSGVIRNPDYTMEQMISVIKELREVHRFNGYIHMKSIPGTSQQLVNQAGLLVDRLSVNIEIPTEESLKKLAPEKDYHSVWKPMKYIKQGILENSEDRKKFHKVPKFVPGGQSTQMIVGATPETDNQILTLASKLYNIDSMKRVYYSGYIHLNQNDNRLPILKQPPLVREHRLYQADWLLRFYNFQVNEIVDDTNPTLDLEIDPKMSWALRHPEFFPVDVNTASYEEILRIPGVGVMSARKIITARRFGRLTSEQLKKIGVVMKRAKYFIVCRELVMNTVNEVHPEFVRKLLIDEKIKEKDKLQLSLEFEFKI